MQIINLTPHELVIVNSSGHSWRTYPTTGHIARVSLKYQPSGMVESLQTFRVVPGEVEGLPDPKPDTIFVVSAVLASMVKRSDVMSPGELVRNALGHPVACKGLQRWD